MSFVHDITAYSYADILKELGQYLKDDIEIDFETNEGYPKQIGIVFTCRVQKKNNLKPLETTEPIVSVVTDSVDSANSVNSTNSVDKPKQTRRAKASEQ